MALAVVCLFLILGSTLVKCHDESGNWHCEPDDEARIAAEFMPGLITLDGQADDWANIDGFAFSLLPALDPDQENQYNGGKMTVKALHDGKDVYFLLQVDGDYVYTKGDDYKCPSVALMFQVGQAASYHNMGGCKELPGSCSSKSCRGYEVDIMHFAIGSAVPGRLYGGDSLDNRDGSDRSNHLVDLFAWNPHCRNYDGTSASGNESIVQNNWLGAWWHSSFTTYSGFTEEDTPYASPGQKGTYFFEFSRPLRTMDRLQQDIQFTIGQSSMFSAAFWYPFDGKPWQRSEHYSISCDWVPLDISTGSTPQFKVVPGSSWDAAGAFALLLSVVSFCLSVFIGYWVSRTKGTVPFTPMERL